MLELAGRYGRKRRWLQSATKVVHEKKSDRRTKRAVQAVNGLSCWRPSNRQSPRLCVRQTQLEPLSSPGWPPGFVAVYWKGPPATLQTHSVRMTLSPGGLPRFLVCHSRRAGLTTVIWVLAVLDMGCSFRCSPKLSVARWRVRSTAAPSQEKSNVCPPRQIPCARIRVVQ
jgi:hypothetical protein